MDDVLDKRLTSAPVASVKMRLPDGAWQDIGWTDGDAFSLVPEDLLADPEPAITFPASWESSLTVPLADVNPDAVGVMLGAPGPADGVPATVTGTDDPLPARTARFMRWTGLRLQGYCTHSLPGGTRPNGCPCLEQAAGHTRHRCEHGRSRVCLA